MAWRRNSMFLSVRHKKTLLTISKPESAMTRLLKHVRQKKPKSIFNNSVQFIYRIYQHCFNQTLGVCN